MGEFHTQGTGVVALGMLSFTSVPVTGCRISLGRAQPLQLEPDASPCIPISSPQPLHIPMPWVPEGFRLTVGAGRARGLCHAQGTSTVVSGICKAVMWVNPTCSPSVLLGPGGKGRSEGVQVGARAEPATQGLGKPQEGLSLRDWRLAWKGQSKGKRLGTMNMTGAP